MQFEFSFQTYMSLASTPFVLRSTDESPFHVCRLGGGVPGSAGCVALGVTTSLGAVKLNAGLPTVQVTSLVLRHGFDAWVRLNFVNRSIAGMPPFVKSYSTLIVHVPFVRPVIELR